MITATQMKEAYSEMPENDQILVASFIAADLMTKDSEFAEKLSLRHKQMDEGEKHTHAELQELHDRLEQKGTSRC